MYRHEANQLKYYSKCQPQTDRLSENPGVHHQVHAAYWAAANHIYCTNVTAVCTEHIFDTVQQIGRSCVREQLTDSNVNGRRVKTDRLQLRPTTGRRADIVFILDIFVTAMPVEFSELAVAAYDGPLDVSILAAMITASAAIPLFDTSYSSFSVFAGGAMYRGSLDETELII